MPVPRLHVPLPLVAGDSLVLPEGPARHVQVLRLQPGAPLTLFDGRGGEHDAEVLRMGRSEVAVRVGARHEVERELLLPVTLAVGMPANDRMDGLVEKATELGAAAIQPLVCERSVLRLAGERAERRREHWQSIAVSAAEQCGRTRVMRVEPVTELRRWLDGLPSTPSARWLLSPGASARLPSMPRPAQACVLSGPEGGLSAQEEDAAVGAGFERVGLGDRILRADTAPLAVLAWVAVGSA